MKELVLGICLLLSTIPEDVIAESDSDEFKFSETIAIYDLVENGGIIYARPDRYDENNGFIQVYESLDQYLAELNGSMDEPFFPTEDQPLTGELMLVTGSSQKKYLLKEGWLGDGESWVPMQRKDYNSLRNMIDSRRRLSGAVTAGEGLKAYTAMVRDTVDSDSVSDVAILSGQRQDDGGQVKAVAESVDGPTENNSSMPASNVSSAHDRPETEAVSAEGEAQPFATRPMSSNPTNAPELGFSSGNLSSKKPADRDATATSKESSHERSLGINWKWSLFAIAIFVLALYLRKKR